MMSIEKLKSKSLHRPPQHKRFVSNGTRLNFCSAKTSFILETLGEIVPLKGLPPISIRENDTNGWIRL